MMKWFFSIVIVLSLCSCNHTEGTMDILGKTELQKIFTNWMKNGGDLSELLGDLDDQPITKKQDAKAISEALKSISIKEPLQKDQFRSPLYSLASLFQQVESEHAFEEFVISGLPELRRIFREGLKYPENRESDLMFILKIFAMYQQEEDAVLIVETARKGFQSDGYMWSVILDLFDEEHPYRQVVLDGLRKPLPDDFLCIAYLDFINTYAIKHGIKKHPFDNEDGVERLRAWLEDKNEDNFSYAYSAAATIPFLNRKFRTPLLELAQKHVDNGVKIEAAWAMGKINDSQGIENLKKWAVDINYSSVACQYLKELGYEHEIPAKALDNGFQAMAEMVNWLSHPNEYGRPPDTIELYDTRTLYWPPTEDKRKLWLFKYSYDPQEKGEDKDTGISMVGSVTFALFGEATIDLTPEEVYGLHCAWELEMNESPLLKEKRSPQAGLAILRTYNNDI